MWESLTKLPLFHYKIFISSNTMSTATVFVNRRRKRWL